MAATAATELRIRAANLGGWLVIEGWMTPDLFDEIPNKEFLDGRQLQFKSVTTGKYLCAENGGGSTIVANRVTPLGWETFKVWRVNETTFQFRVNNGQFIGLGGDGGVTAVAFADTPGKSETFQIVHNRDRPERVRIQAPNGLFLRANSETSVKAESNGTGDWGDGDGSVFILTIFGSPMQGEFQLTNGYGPDRAASVLKSHWESYIVEDDFRYMRDKGLNAVRIPVGWWIAYDPAPLPFVTGSLQALDNAFNWADKYGLGVIVDLHAAPGSQNYNDHSGSRDGSTVAWGSSDNNIQQTVQVIDFLASRYASRPSLLGIELLNEPRAPAVSLDALQKYYRAGYDAVRKHTSKAYVIMSNRLGSDPTELLDFAGPMRGTVVDVHYYNLFTTEFEDKSAQWNIDYIYRDRSDLLRSITRANGPLIFVGEWVAEWIAKGATDADYRRFVAAELQVFAQATFGWAYWTYKHRFGHWSLRSMIDDGYIKLA